MKRNTIQLSLFDVFGETNSPIPTTVSHPTTIQTTQTAQTAQTAQFDTDTAGAIDFLLSLIPSDLSDNALVGLICFNDKENKPILKFINDTAREQKAFFKAADKHQADEAEIIGRVGKFRNIRHSIEAVHYLKLWGYNVDASEKTNFYPNFPKQAYFAYCAPTVQGVKNENIEINFHKGWKVFQYVEISNENRGADVAELVFSNRHFLEGNAHDCSLNLKNDDHLKALFDLGYMKEVGNDVVEAYKEFKRYHFLAEYQIIKDNVIITMFRNGNQFFCTTENADFSLESTVRNSASEYDDETLEKFAFRILNDNPDISFIKGKDVLKIDALKQDHRAAQEKALSLLSPDVRAVCECATNDFFKSFYYYGIAAEDLAEKVEKIILKLITNSENALKDAASTREYFDVTLCSKSNHWARIVFCKIAGVDVPPNFKSMTKANKEKWIDDFVISRFGAVA